MTIDYSQPSYDQRFKDKQECFNACIEVREMFGSMLSTKPMFHQAHKMLGIILMYCPEEARLIIESTREELETRYELIFDTPFILDMGVLQDDMG